MFLEGSDCYALRCADLHQGELEITSQRARQVLERFHFTKPRPGMLIHDNLVSSSGGVQKALQLQIDQFCLDISEGVTKWLRDVESDASIQSRMDALGAFL